MTGTPVIYVRDGRRPRLPHAAPIVRSRRLSVVGAHGSGVVAGAFVSDVAGYQAAVDRAGDAVTPDWFGDNVRGSLCGYVWDRERRALLVLPDPLAGGLVYLFRGDGFTAVSSGLGELVAALDRLGCRPRRSLGFLAEVVATTNGGWAHPASYEGIEVLEPFEYLRISRRDGVQRAVYRARARMLDAAVPYEQRFAAAAGEIRSNVAALAAARHDPKILHLTAGFDSRLVLAAALEGGYAGRFHFVCDGPEDTPDKRISAALAAQLGLTMTDGPGAALAEHPRTLTDQVLWPMRAAHGMATVGPHRGHRPGRSVIGSGGYGEVARSFYGHRVAGLDPHDVAAVAGSLWGTSVLSTQPESLLAPELAEHFLTRLAARVAAAAGAGVRADALWDYLYLTGRNRYFVGEISRQWTPVAARFDPLYSPSAAAAALHLPLAARAANIIGFDLMRLFCPLLAELPFDRDRYTPTYVQLRGEPQRRDFAPGLGPPKREVLFPAPPPRRRESFPEPTAADRELAAKLQIIPAQAASIRRMRADVQRLAGELGPAHLDPIVHRPVFDAFLRNRINNRSRFRALAGLRTALLWYTDPEEPADRVRPWTALAPAVIRRRWIPSGSA